MTTLRRTLTILTTTIAPAMLLAQAPADTPAAKLRRSSVDAMGGGATLPDTVITATARTSYSATDATTASRLPEPILDTPRSVQVVTPQVLQDQAVNDPQEAVRNVSGTIRGASYNGIGETFIIRGFQQEDIIKDGFRAGTASNTGLTATGPTDLANIDRVEVLKGPAAILYGRGEPGGIVNYITRTPAFENRFGLQQSIGSYDFYRTELNANWNAVPDRFALRLDAAYDNTESFIDFLEGERWIVAPAFKWQIGPDTTLTFRGEYTWDDRSTNPGLPYDAGRVIPNIPYSRYFGEPGFTEFEHETWRGIVHLEHRWSDWAKTTLTAHGRTSSEEGNYFLLYNFAGPLQDPITGDIARAVSINDHEDENFAVRLDQLFEWTLWEAPGLTETGKDGKTMSADSGFAIKNQLLIAGEFERQTQDHHRILGANQPLNPYDPHYTGYAPIPLVPFPGFPLKFDEFTDASADAWSVLLMNRLSFGDTVHLSLGGRVEWFDSQRTLRYPTPGTPFAPSSGGQSDVIFNPSVGLVVKPARNVAIYGSYAESTNTFLNAFAGSTASGEALDPERSRQYEVGVKVEFLERRLIASASLFQIEKEDVAGADPNNPFFVVNAGEERSRGFEIDVAGEILPGWRVMANYAYIDAEITDAPLGLNVGHRRWGVSENSGGFFTTYEVQGGSLKGLGFGGGMFFADRVEVDNANTGNLSGYATTDLVLYYQAEHWRAQVNVKNLFDNEFYYATSNNTMVQPGGARSIVASLRFEF